MSMSKRFERIALPEKEIQVVASGVSRVVDRPGLGPHSMDNFAYEIYPHRQTDTPAYSGSLKKLLLCGKRSIPEVG
jgi:hypothetical protein